MSDSPPWFGRTDLWHDDPPLWLLDRPDLVKNRPDWTYDAADWMPPIDWMLEKSIQEQAEMGVEEYSRHFFLDTDPYRHFARAFESLVSQTGAADSLGVLWYFGSCAACVSVEIDPNSPFIFFNDPESIRQLHGFSGVGIICKFHHMASFDTDYPSCYARQFRAKYEAEHAVREGRKSRMVRA